MANAQLHTQEGRVTIFTEEPPFPRNMMIELTNACNHQCVFCGNRNQERKIVNADKELMYSIIDQGSKLGVKEIGFYLSGEPLLCRDLEDYILYAKNADRGGIGHIYITSNGVLANIDRVRKLAKAGLSSIKFSVNASTADTYKKIHGHDDFEKVKQNIMNIHEAIEAGEFELSTFISFVRCKLNQDETDMLRYIFEPYVDNIVIYDMHAQKGDNILVDELMPDNPVDFSLCPCTMIFNRIHITADGYLDACCIDYDNSTAVEDLRKKSLKEAWYGSRMKRLRHEHLTRQLSKNKCYYCVRNIASGEFEPLNRDLYVKERNKNFC